VIAELAAAGIPWRVVKRARPRAPQRRRDRSRQAAADEGEAAIFYIAQDRHEADEERLWRNGSFRIKRGKAPVPLRWIVADDSPDRRPITISTGATAEHDAASEAFRRGIGAEGADTAPATPQKRARPLTVAKYRAGNQRVVSASSATYPIPAAPPIRNLPRLAGGKR